MDQSNLSLCGIYHVGRVIHGEDGIIPLLSFSFLIFLYFWSQNLMITAEETEVSTRAE